MIEASTVGSNPVQKRKTIFNIFKIYIKKITELLRQTDIKICKLQIFILSKHRAPQYNSTSNISRLYKKNT